MALSASMFKQCIARLDKTVAVPGNDWTSKGQTVNRWSKADFWT